MSHPLRARRAIFPGGCCVPCSSEHEARLYASDNPIAVSVHANVGENAGESILPADASAERQRQVVRDAHTRLGRRSARHCPAVYQKDQALTVVGGGELEPGCEGVIRRPLDAKSWSPGARDLDVRLAERGEPELHPVNARSAFG